MNGRRLLSSIRPSAVKKGKGLPRFDTEQFVSSKHKVAVNLKKRMERNIDKMDPESLENVMNMANDEAEERMSAVQKVVDELRTERSKMDPENTEKILAALEEAGVDPRELMNGSEEDVETRMVEKIAWEIIGLRDLGKDRVATQQVEDELMKTYFAKTPEITQKLISRVQELSLMTKRERKNAYYQMQVHPDSVINSLKEQKDSPVLTESMRLSVPRYTGEHRFVPTAAGRGSSEWSKLRRYSKAKRRAREKGVKVPEDI